MIAAPVTDAPKPATWSAVRSQRLSAATAYAPSSAFAPSGLGFLALTPETRRGQTLAAYRDASQIRVIGPSGGIGRVFRLPDASGVLADRAGRDGRVVVVAVPTRTPRTVTLSDLTPTGRLLRRQSIAAPDRLDRYASLCAGPSGDAVVVWSERKGKGATTLAMARRPARGRLSPRIALSTTTPWTFDCSVAADGRWIVAAAIRPRSGDGSVPRLRVWTGFTGRAGVHRIDLGDAPYSTELETAIDGRGRSFVVWRDQLPDSGFAAGPDETFHVRAASVGPDGHTATPAQMLETGRANGGPGHLAVSPTGGAALEVTLPQLEEDVDEDAPPGVTVTVATPDGAFAPLSAPIPGATSQGPVAYRANGTPIVTWQGPAGGHELVAALSGTELGPVEDTGLPGGASFVTATRSGEPRLFSLAVKKSGTRLLSVTRRGR